MKMFNLLINIILNQEQQINFIKDKTKNNLIDRGLIEKIFGGIGKQKLSDNSQ